jgi:hypothetical protein
MTAVESTTRAPSSLTGDQLVSILSVKRPAADLVTDSIGYLRIDPMREFAVQNARDSEWLDYDRAQDKKMSEHLG